VLKVEFVIVLLIGLFKVSLVDSQETYNACSQALELCPNQVFTVNNQSANITFCPGCEDDFSFCFSPSNSIWLTFTTNAIGGNVDVDFSNLNFEVNAGQGTEIQASILSATVPCNSASYTQLGNCITNGTTDFTLSAAGLLPNSVYFIVITGSSAGAGVTLPAECTMDISISGTSVDRPISSVDLTLSDETICANDLLTATASVINCPDTAEYRWYVNGVLSAVTTEPQFLSTAIVDGAIISVETSCYTLCPVAVNATSNPVDVTTVLVDAGTAITISFGDTVQLFGSTNASFFEWSPGFGVSAVDALSPFVWPTVSTTYTLTATEGDCTLSDQVLVTVEPKLIFPNTFSPNNDGLNDTWQIEGIELYPDCFVRIHDRWGQEVYQSTGYSDEKAWTGESRSGALSEGVYFYIIDLRDEEKQQFKGSITLIR
jgi:gliding motility-associated-like protein